jgi:hypothetical protein
MQKQKLMQKSKKIKSQKNKNNLNRNITTLSKGGLFNRTSTAASYEVALENPTKFEITGKGLAHSEWGSALRVTGRQQLVTVATTASNTNLFTGGLATSSANQVLVAPSTLNDRIAAISALYQRYAFRNLRFIYVTRVGSTQVGSLALAYTSDSGISFGSDAVTPTYASLQDIEPCKIFPFRKESEILNMSYSGDRTWYVDTNNGGTAESVRQNYQGAFLGFPDITSIGAVSMGEIYIEYVLDLYVPSVMNTDVTFLSKDVKSSLKLLKRKFNSAEVEEGKALMIALDNYIKKLLF